jgi:hypothetical protein
MNGVEACSDSSNFISGISFPCRFLELIYFANSILDQALNPWHAIILFDVNAANDSDKKGKHFSHIRSIIKWLYIHAISS